MNDCSYLNRRFRRLYSTAEGFNPYISLKKALKHIMDELKWRTLFVGVANNKCGGVCQGDAVLQWCLIKNIIKYDESLHGFHVVWLHLTCVELCTENTQEGSDKRGYGGLDVPLQGANQTDKSAA